MLSVPDKATRFLLLGLVGGLVVSACVAGLGVILDLIETGPLWRNGEFRLELFTGYPPTLGFMAGLALTGQFFFWWHGRILFTQKTDIALIGMVFTLLILSQTRAALFALLITLGISLILAAKRPLRMFALVTLCGIFLAGSAWSLGRLEPLANSPIYQRMISLLHHPLQDPAITGRLAIWEIATRSIADRPALGYGLRRFPPVYDFYMKTYGEELRSRYVFVEEEGGHGHNLVLGILSELGLLGFLSLFFLYLHAFRVKSIPSRANNDIPLLQIFLVYFLIHGTIEYMFPKVIYGDLFFGTIGLLMGSSYLAWRQKKTAHASDLAEHHGPPIT